MTLPHDDRSVVAMGERVARVETKIEGIEKDTSVIRQAIHGINGEMQKFVQAEQRCVDGLLAVQSQTAHLPELAFAMKEFTALQPRIVSLLEAEHRRVGAWKSWVVFGSAVAGAIGIITGIIVAAIEIIGYLHPK